MARMSGRTSQRRVALSLVTGQASGAGLGRSGAEALALLFIDLQHDGFVISQMFFALWLLPLGYLVVRSGAFPKVLGYLLWVACVGYLVDLFIYFLTPGIEDSVLPFTAAAGAIGELGFIAWLLVKGARVPDGGADAPVSRAAAGLP